MLEVSLVCQHVLVEERLSLDFVGLEVIELIANDVDGVDLLVYGSARSPNLRPERHRGFLKGKAIACLVRAKVNNEWLSMHFLDVFVNLGNDRIGRNLILGLTERLKVEDNFLHWLGIFEAAYNFGRMCPCVKEIAE